MVIDFFLELFFLNFAWLINFLLKLWLGDWFFVELCLVIFLELVFALLINFSYYQVICGLWRVVKRERWRICSSVNLSTDHLISTLSLHFFHPSLSIWTFLLRIKSVYETPYFVLLDQSNQDKVIIKESLIKFYCEVGLFSSQCYVYLSTYY